MLTDVAARRWLTFLLPRARRLPPGPVRCFQLRFRPALGLRLVRSTAIPCLDQRHRTIRRQNGLPVNNVGFPWMSAAHLIRDRARMLGRVFTRRLQAPWACLDSPPAPASPANALPNGGSYRSGVICGQHHCPLVRRFIFVRFCIVRTLLHDIRTHLIIGQICAGLSPVFHRTGSITSHPILGDFINPSARFGFRSTQAGHRLPAI